MPRPQLEALRLHVERARDHEGGSRIAWCTDYFFFLYIFMGFCVYVPLPPLRGQHTVLCHPRWLPTSGLTEFAVCWGGAGFEPRTTDLQSGALPLSHLSSSGSDRSEGGGWRESKKSNEPSNLPRMYKNSQFYALIDFKIAKNAVFYL